MLEKKSSNVSPKQANWLSGITSFAYEKHGHNAQDVDIITFAERTKLDGNAFDLSKHEYQRAILQCDAPQQVFIKGAQVGITSVTMLKRIFNFRRKLYKQGALYLFPTRDDVADFARGRMEPLINDNPEIARMIRSKSTDAQNIKRINGQMLYMRGARASKRIGGIKKSSTQLKSVPVDALVFDERDEMEESMVDLALHRIDHSDVKEEIHLGTPTLCDYGIDKMFQASDQRHWYLKCPKCGKYTCLELEFPNCLEVVEKNKVIRLCQRCRDAELDPKVGVWVASNTDNASGFVGWRISQLNSLYVNPLQILTAFNNPPHGNISEFMNSRLGFAYTEAENRLSQEQILELCSDEPMKEKDNNPCFLGCDVGKVLHVVVARPEFHNYGRVLWIGEVPDWNGLDELMRRFNVSHAVVDKQPELHNSTEFCEKWKNKAWACQYSESPGNGYQWGDGLLKCNRTESLDASNKVMAEGDIILPALSPVVQEFAKHCNNVARRLEEDAETGRKRYVYLKLGVDHYRHAFNYCALALSKVQHNLDGQWGGD